MKEIPSEPVITSTGRSRLRRGGGYSIRLDTMEKTTRGSGSPEILGSGLGEDPPGGFGFGGRPGMDEERPNPPVASQAAGVFWPGRRSPVAGRRSPVAGRAACGVRRENAEVPQRTLAETFCAGWSLCFRDRVSTRPLLFSTPKTIERRESFRPNDSGCMKNSRTTMLSPSSCRQQRRPLLCGRTPTPP